MVKFVYIYLNVWERKDRKTTAKWKKSKIKMLHKDREDEVSNQLEQWLSSLSNNFDLSANL